MRSIRSAAAPPCSWPTDSGVMVNEEDHLRLQALRSGFALQEAFAAIDKLDRDLGARRPVFVSQRVRAS